LKNKIKYNKIISSASEMIFDDGICFKTTIKGIIMSFSSSKTGKNPGGKNAFID
jgi:hypothetical protein